MARSLIASDAITGTANTALGSNWSQIGQFATSSANVVYAASNRCYGHTDSSECAARWNGSGTFANDQYSTLEIYGTGTESWSSYMGVIARASADQDGSRDYYYARIFDRQDAGNNRVELSKVVNGTTTILDNTPSSVAWSAGNRIEIECEGTTIRALKNGTSYHSATDSALSSGKPGIYALTRDALTGDNWEGGDITGGGGAATRGLPFGNRSTAFNGGRTLQGIM